MAVKKVKPTKKEEKYSLASDVSRTSRRAKNTTSVGLKEQLCNIYEGILPTCNGTKFSGVSITDTILACQMAYFNISIFRNTIDTQSEFANSPLHFKGGSESSRAFYEAWYKRINGHRISDQFFREWYRSSNIFLYKTYLEFDRQELDRLQREFGTMPKNLLDKSVPFRYILLNPVDIKADECSIFSEYTYVKVLNPYEREVLKQGRTEEAIKFLKSLPNEVRDDIMNGRETKIPLDSDRLIAVFAKKQDYEAMAVPMYYPVLPDINTKLEFKKAELAIARQVDYMILLVTMGDEKNGMNKKLADSIQALLSKDSVTRAIISDYTTKMEFIIPDFNKIMGPEKYEIIDKDISSGLMNIFFSDEKFANGLIKTKIFIERLNEARKAYLNNFLIPEMESIAKALNFRDVPTPEFEEINVNDPTQTERIYTRLLELGAITPEELFGILETGILPTKESSLQSQEEFRELKDKGLYEPLLGGPKEDTAGAGRPNGTKAPQTTKKVSPQSGVGAFSLSKIKETTNKANNLIGLVETEFKRRHGHQRLSARNKDLAFEITKNVISNEPIDKWESMYLTYFDNLIPPSEIFNEVCEVASEHSLDLVSASILFNSKHEPDKTATA